MLDFAIEKWNKNKDKLKKYFKEHKQNDYAGNYEDFTKKVIDIIFNDGDYEFDIKNYFQKIDFGDYQGTLIFVFAYDTYQPSADETFYTTVHYGTCSGCDTLLSICSWDYEEKPSEEQVKDYMKLALNLIQEMKCFGGDKGV